MRNPSQVLKAEFPANLEIREIREKSGNQTLFQIVREKSENFQFLTKSQGKTVCGYENFQKCTFHCIF